jgi:hypothetical protein
MPALKHQKRNQPKIGSTPPPETSKNDTNQKLNIYKLGVVVKNSLTKENAVIIYYVEAPTQCSAMKHTALRDEVSGILHIELTHQVPKDTQLTFSTTKDCP